jgi:hypothetical protein
LQNRIEKMATTATLLGRPGGKTNNGLDASQPCFMDGLAILSL